MKNSLHKSIAIITPAKNESSNISSLVGSFSKQTFMPKLWVFVNDGSTDDTVKVFENEVKKNKQLFKQCEIRLVNHRDPDSGYALGEKYSRVIKFGMDEVFNHENNNNKLFDYIGILDADVFPQPDYYEKIITKFHLNPKLGIAAAGTQIEFSEDGSKTLSKNNRSHAPGGFRVWRRECLEKTGYTPSVSQDAVSQARAILLNWEVKSFSDIKVEMRKRGSVFGYQYYGKSAYVRWVPFFYVLLGALKLYLNNRYNDANLYLAGYKEAKKNNVPRIKDPIAKKYFRNRLIYKLMGK